MSAQIEAASETRNSGSRKWITAPIRVITRTVHKSLPWLSPTHINILGVAEVGLGAIAATKGNIATAATLIVSGSLMDAFDGTLARMIAAEDPDKVNFKKGQIYDASGDRAQELLLTLSRIWSAGKRGSKLGELAALATAVSSPLPSISRAFSESLGKSVPESGKGIVGLIGTRPGRAVLGTVGTLNDKFQLGVDIAMTASNVATTVDRLKTAFKPGKVSLSSETKKDAKTRLKVLGTFGALALGASFFTYWRLNRRELQEKPEVQQDTDLMYVIGNVDQYCRAGGLDHRFVGGTITDFIGPQTQFDIDVHNKTVTLINPNKPALKRPDETVKDIDMVVFTADRLKFLDAGWKFAQWAAMAKAEGRSFPRISIEAARYPDWQKRNKWKQFVTAWEVDKNDVPHLAFGDVDQALNPASIEPWTVDLGNGVRITTFNPVAHALCYSLRVPSGIKRKDREEIGKDANGKPFSKISLIERLACQTIEQGLRMG